MIPIVPLRTIALALLLAALAPAAASAHEFWLSPSTYRAAPNQTVAIVGFVGTGFRGEPRPYARARTERLTAEGKKRVDLVPRAVTGENTYARIRPPDASGFLVAYESSFIPIELAATEFDRYLKLEGLDGPLAERKRSGSATTPGRERYARCAKTWIAGGDAGRVTRPVGLTLELVPLDDPARPGPLRFKLLHGGRPLAGALVRAWNQPLAADGFPADAAARDSVGPATEGRTGADGTVTLALAGGGEWLVSAVHMVPSTDRAEADWQSWWASISFARPAKP